MEGYLVHASTMSTVRINSDGNPVKTCGSLQQSEILLERELKVMESLDGGKDGLFPRVISSSGEDDQLSITMTRVGTHDLNDAMHEISIESIPELFLSMISGIQGMHEQGFVHRDVKPGNFMINHPAREGLQGLTGIIDFGLSIRINRKQNEPGALGGTRPYSHPSQTSRECKDLRAHPGQDWFALARTMAHLLVGGSKDSLTSMIESGNIAPAVEKALTAAWRGDPPRQLRELLSFSFSPASEDESALQELDRLGRECAAETTPPKKPLKDRILTILDLTKANQPGLYASLSTGGDDSNVDRIETIGDFQINNKDRPKRHDLLLIVDSTGSMSDEIDDLRNNLQEVSKEVSSKIDLRVDIWLLGDYSRDDSQADPVRVIGKRLRSDALRMAISHLKADSEQLDDAEAYEAALQDAYLKDEWSPRSNSTRNIILIGDSYAHGWLTKSFWGKFFFEMKGTQGRRGRREDYVNKFRIFEDRHPDALAWWNKKPEEKARNEAVSVKSEHDDFSTRGHVFVPSNRGKRYRPNIRKSLERCLSRKEAKVHAIFAGENLVARNFMKYTALMGEGTYTEVARGELKLALTGLITSPDPSLFEAFNSQVQSSNPDTDVLSSITSFIQSDESDGETDETDFYQ